MKTVLLALPMAVTLWAQQPVLDCAILDSQTGRITAWFGYTGATPGSTVPLGANNYVDSAGTLYGTIPVNFAQAAGHVLFSVKFSSASSAGWHVNGQAAIADAASIAASPCQPAVGSALPSYAQLRCWDRSNDNRCDIAEDVDGDGYCTILDCAGPPGSAGADGTRGPTGPAGPAGPTGTPPVLQTIVSAPGTATATAICNSTQFLLTGGGTCTVPNLAGAGRIASSAPSSAGNGWEVSCNAGQAEAVAVCAAKQ
jgi:hypothetical protein